jgi:2-octaprenyl-6-methoxyphenol hydroxylase
MTATHPAGSHYDVAIIGGGLVVASLACALEPLGLRTALVEAVEFRAASQPSYDDRTLALSASSCRILEGLGVWPQLRDNATAIREIHVRELKRPGRVVMDPAELGLDRFGHVVEARVFGAAMLETLQGLENIDFICPATVGEIELTDEGARIGFDENGSDRSLSASLLVGADGANSFVRESLGIEAERHDYGQTAVICNITPEEEHRGRAFECFTPTGPMAVMPHVEGRCGLIWCVASEDADDLLNLPEAEFLARAERRFDGPLGRFVKLGRRSSYPLKLVRALEDIRPSAVILGNAAHAIHPIGAQGFNLGLRDAAVLAELLAEEVRGKGAGNIGSLDVLRRYSEWRAPDQSGTIAYSDGLARMFSNTRPISSLLRTTGLLAHAFVPPLRRQLAIRAMGYRGRIPRLAMGEPL